MPLVYKGIKYKIPAPNRVNKLTTFKVGVRELEFPNVRVPFIQKINGVLSKHEQVMVVIKTECENTSRDRLGLFLSQLSANALLYSPSENIVSTCADYGRNCARYHEKPKGKGVR